MSGDPEVLIAEAEAQAARSRFFATLGEVQQRLKPSTLAQDAMETATQGVTSATRKGVEAVRERPVVSGAVAAGVGLFLARGWIARLFRRTPDETPPPPRGLNLTRHMRQRAKKG